MKNFKIIIIFILIFIVNSSYGQNKNPILTNNYYKINKKQKSIVEFYLLARYYYPFGKIRSYNKMYSTSPDLIAIDKNGKILDFDSYKSEYKNSSESKKEFSINLFYLGYNNSKNNNELIMSYTVLEPNWENVLEVKEYEYRKECPIGCQELYERPVRKVHKPIIIYKFNQKFLIYYMNDYE